MRLEFPYRTERFGAVRIHERQRVIELDGGGLGGNSTGSAQVVGIEQIRAIERDLVIVVPCKNESRRVLEGVLSGIPHGCLIVLVSNSDRAPVDRYELETGVLQEFCRLSDRPAVIVHQRDAGLASAFKAAGMPELLDDAGLIRNGKGEAMLIGIALAALTGRKHVGYVDADNYIPGAVHEYCHAYAAGLAIAASKLAMVRISWHSKPKVSAGKLVFNRCGRASEVTNDCLNSLLAEHSGFGTEAIVTGNAGEHAVTLDLGLRMRMAGGYAVEPFQFVDVFEQFGGLMPDSDPAAMAEGVDILQIQTRNPHFHDDRGDGHVTSMLHQALQVIYHSPLCRPQVRTKIENILGVQPLPPDRIYPPVGSLTFDVLFDGIIGGAETLCQFTDCLSGQVAEPAPKKNTDPSEH